MDLRPPKYEVLDDYGQPVVDQNLDKYGRQSWPFLRDEQRKQEAQRREQEAQRVKGEKARTINVRAARATQSQAAKRKLGDDE